MKTKVISCSAPYGGGGLGQHLAQVVEEARENASLNCYFCGRPKSEDYQGQEVQVKQSQWLNFTPVRFSPGWKSYISSNWFDQAVAARLDQCEIFEGFSGQALHSFRKARQLGVEKLYLQSPTAHVLHVARQYKKATQQFRFEASWLNKAQITKSLKEYKMADIIYVASEYSRQTFLAHNIPAHKLKKIDLKVHPRFVPPSSKPQDGIFRIVYTGSLTVTKGVPLLIEAFAQLPDKNAQLTLVGGWATRGMRRYLQRCIVQNPRIRIVSGDPLPYLQQADLYVHPSYQDGFGYAPMEALACGVLVIVTEETGMKEHIQEGVNGFIVSAENREDFLERLISYKNILSKSRYTV